MLSDLQHEPSSCMGMQEAPTCCTDCLQVFILDSLATYTARDAKDAEAIIERVTPRLQHANCAVVLSAVKVCLGYSLNPSPSMKRITAQPPAAQLSTSMNS